MAHVNVPLAIGGGEALHDASLQRELIYAQFRGQEGFIETPQILETSPPSGAIRVLPVPYTIRARHAANIKENYYGKVSTEEVIPIPPAPPNTARSVLAYFSVEDPYPSGGVAFPYPTDRANGPYVFSRVKDGVPANAISPHTTSGIAAGNYIAVARVDMPSQAGGVATIFQSMIKPLGVVVNPLNGIQLPADVVNNYYTVQQTISVPAPSVWTEATQCSANSVLLHTNNSFINWPSEANWNVPIPPYANIVEAFVMVLHPAQSHGHVYGETRLTLDGAATSGNVTSFNMDSLVGNVATPINRIHIANTGTYPVPSSCRGRKINVRLQARQYVDGATLGRLTADNRTSIYLNLQFKERP